MQIPIWLRPSLLIGLLYCASTFAEAPLQFNVGLTPFSDQLSQPTITAIHRDKSGFLWIGTQLGLNRFDGSINIIFDSSNSSAHWVPASDISQIAEDSSGKIWIATYGGGLAKYDEITKKFVAISPTVESEYLYLTALRVSSSGTIWFGTRDAGIRAYDPKLQRYVSWIEFDSLNKDILGPSDIVEDLEGYIWTYGTYGLYRISPLEKSITLHKLPTSESTKDRSRKITTLKRGPNGLIFIGTNNGTIHVFNPGNFSFVDNELLSDPANGPIRDFYIGERNIWIAADNGLALLERASSAYRIFSQNNSSLATHGAISLFHDSSSLFVGTPRGLYSISNSFFEKYQNKNSKVFDDVLSFAESLNGESWVGTFDGVYKFNAKLQSHSPIEHIFSDIELNDRRVMTMAVKGNELWLGFFRGGVQIINLERGSSRTLDFPNNIDLAVTKILHLEDGSTWIGTYNRGLFHIEGNRIKSFYDPENSRNKIPELAVTLILEANNGSVIIGAETKIYTVDQSAASVQAQNLIFHEDKAQPVILSMALSSNGDVWVGTKDQGLFIWNFQSDSTGEIQLEHAKGNSKFPSSTIYAIEFDEQGFAWISTTNGITKLNSKGEFIKSFKESDGLQGSDFNFSASFRDSKGRLYFGGSNGYNRFDPSRTAITSPPPPVVLTGFNIAGSEPDLPVAAHKLKKIELSNQDYFVTFSFSALDYADPDNNRFRYKLDNFDPQWIENDKRNTATYTNLPPGIYTFRVQGASSAGIWNLEGTSIELVVHPSLWLSWQAYLIYLIMLAIIILLGKEYYDNIVLRKKAAAMAQEMHYAADRATDNLQEQLEYQDGFVKSVHAHSINTLDLIAEFISRQSDSFDDDLFREAILSNTYRVRALTQLEDCLFYQGDRLLANMEDFTNAVIDQLLSEAPELALSTTTINEMPSRLMPVELATPLAIVIFELLRNCFQHAFENSSHANYIHIRMEEVISETPGQEKKLMLCIQDNGIGIPGNISPNSVETSGLPIVSSIASMINGTLSISSENGTTVSLVFPNPPDLI